MNQHYAAVDLGAESGRVVLGAFDGQRLELDDVHRFANAPVSALGTLYWDVLRLWHDINAGLQKAVAMVGPDLTGIGVDTWGVDFALLDSADALLGNPVHYRDKRNDGAMERAFATVPRDELYAATGLQFMPFNTLFQLLALKERGSAQLEAARTLLFMPDLLHFWLTGTKANEYTIASTSQMLDPEARSWNAGLLQRFGLGTELFPPLHKPGSLLGHLLPGVATATGISPATPVFAPGSHDTASAVAAVPGEGSDWAYLSSGTWSLMGVELAQPLVNPQVAQLNFTNEGGVANTIRFLKNIAGLWLVQECRRTWLRHGSEHTYPQLSQLAAEAPALACIIDPDDATFAAPADMPKAVRDFCSRTGQKPPSSVGETIRCCLESLALKYRLTFEQLQMLHGAPLRVLHIVGGGTQNTLLNQLAADALDRPVVCGPVEATAAGNILTQAMARGELDGLADVRSVVRRSFDLTTYRPDPVTRGAWDDAYGKFLALTPERAA